MDSQGMLFEEPLFQVGDLGGFSMQAIYDALVANEHFGTPSARVAIPDRRPSHQFGRILERDPEDSDCSWTQDDDNGTFYFDIGRELDHFAASSDTPTMTTSLLSKPQRRFVHATAQIMRLGHASLGPQGKLRQMIIFKDPNAPIPPTSTASSGRQAVGTGAAPATSVSSTTKRRRLERVENGFPCRYYATCDKLFDRASERKKHEQAHQTTYTNRHQCPVCHKGFRYPKDLKRHNKVHDKMTGPGTQSLASSFGSTPLESTLTSDSRVPSNTSLTFSNDTVSKDVSPMVRGHGGGPIPAWNLEPMVLDDNVWPEGCLGGIDEWLEDSQLDAGDVDDDFLEMAQIWK